MSKDEFRWSGTGTVKRIDPFTSKKGVSMPTLVLETEGQYPQLIPCKAFRDMVEEVEALKPGQTVTVKCRVGGRDWNGKAYGDNVLESIEVVGGKEDEPSAPAKDGPAPGDDDLPF